MEAARAAHAPVGQARHIEAVNDPLCGLRKPELIKKATEAMQSAQRGLAQTLDRVPATLLLPISPTSEALTVAERRRQHSEDKEEDRALRTAACQAVLSGQDRAG